MAREFGAVVDIPAVGTRVQLLATPVHHVLAYIIKAADGNTGNIFIGDADVSSSKGFPLAPGKFITWGVGWAQAQVGELHTVLLSSKWVDTATNGNDVEYFVVVTGE